MPTNAPVKFGAPGDVASSESALARHRHRMTPARAAFGHEQVVTASPLVQVRRFHETDGRALENARALAHERARGR
jgi:hypothetical protein